MLCNRKFLYLRHLLTKISIQTFKQTMMRKHLFILAIAALTYGSSKAQLSGSYTVPGIPYANLLLVLNDLNTLGVSGAVTININAGYTEAAPAGGYSLGVIAGVSAINQITFRKNGAGANPVLSGYTGTATPSSAMQDGIWRLVGSNYITIDGIDLNDPNTSNPSTMEYGYGLFRASST